MSEERKKLPELEGDDLELKEKLEMLWTVCPKAGEGKEHDQYIDGVDTGEAGAQRLVGSGESNGNGTEVRIKFTQPKR
jgi:hypothetical protein